MAFSQEIQSKLFLSLLCASFLVIVQTLWIMMLIITATVAGDFPSASYMPGPVLGAFNCHIHFIMRKLSQREVK